MLYSPFEPAPASIRRGSPWQRAALSFVFLWFALGGAAHFLFTDFEQRIVPPMLPMPRLLVYVSGVCELAGAAGLLAERWRRAAGWGLALLTIAVTPANLYMLRIHEQFDVPEWLLWARLPLQLVLLGLIVWGSRWRAPRPLWR